jgi:trigger factor
MKVQVEEVSPIVRRLTVELDPAAVDAALEEAYRGLSHRVKMKGFRPGKAPRRLLEQSFKAEVERDVVETLVRRSYPDAVREHALAPVGDPVVESDKLVQGQTFRYRARIEVKPKLEPKDYKGLPIPARKAEVTDAQLEEELERLRQSLSSLVPVEDRKVAVQGDWAMIDYDLDMPEGGGPELERNRDTPVEVSDGSILAGFVPELRGVEVGQKIDVPFTFPKDYKLTALRGHQTKFHVTLKSIRRREVPTLDDEMVKDLDDPKLKTLADLKASLRDRMVKEAEAEADRAQQEAVFEKLVERNPFEPPQALVERLVETQLKRVAERIVQAGVDPRSVTIDQDKLRKNAELRIKAELLLEAIADKEGISAADADVDSFVEKLAKEEEMPLSKVKAQFARAPARQALLSKLREDKTLAFLVSQATIQ